MRKVKETRHFEYSGYAEKLLYSDEAVAVLSPGSENTEYMQKITVKVINNARLTLK